MASHGRPPAVDLHARISLLETRLQLGQHCQLIPDLEELAAAHPWNEQVHRQLMLALYRVGRQHDALAVFRRLRDTLGEELGVEPGAELRKLETAILRHDRTLATPELAVPRSRVVASAPWERKSLVVPAQLPAAAGSFTGRMRELANLDSVLPGSLSGLGPHAHSDTETGSARPGTVRVITICGSAGIGKTTLAVRWAHRIAHHFPDGQLYVNLRGFDPGGQALDPRRRGTGVSRRARRSRRAYPPELDAQIALYRSLLSGNRILVILDNARDVEQVRPLLPATSRCLAIVTSRRRLTPLVVTEGAHPATLDVLTAAEARDLLTQRLGVDRVAGEPDAVDKRPQLVGQRPQRAAGQDGVDRGWAGRAGRGAGPGRVVRAADRAQAAAATVRCGRPRRLVDGEGLDHR
jgi:Bacterial transcriptional activator domain